MGLLKYFFGQKLKLRPHHVIGFANHEAYPHWYDMSKKEYILNWRKQKGKKHSDRLILFWREVMISMHNNHNIKFEYVFGNDTICENCEYEEECSNPESQYYQRAQKEDRKAHKKLKVLKFGKTYNVRFLLKLFQALKLVKT